jgi:hypothetical protein
VYRLTIVSGPNRGSSFSLSEGENAIGRSEDGRVVLSSSRVSKRHCTVFLQEDELLLQDEGSTNGTFLNGEMVQKKALQPGDRITVGEFVLEVVGSRRALAMAAGGAFAPISGGEVPDIKRAPQFTVIPNVLQSPETPLGKLRVQIEATVMPFFYGVLMKNDYKAVLATVVGVITMAAAMAAVLPTLDSAVGNIDREAVLRAKILARQVADMAAPRFASKTEGEIDVSSLGSEATVRIAAVTNANFQIIAPQSKINQVLTGGREGSVLTRARREIIQSGRDAGLAAQVPGGIAVAVEPIRIVNPKTMQPFLAGFAVVSVDYSRNQLTSGDELVVYATGLLIGLIFAVIGTYLIYRMTLKPFEVLADELDQSLRGVLPKVTREFRFPELQSLWDSINVLIQRAANGGNDASVDTSTDVNWDAELTGVRALADAHQEALVAFDADLNLVAVNAVGEEVVGIRSTNIGSHLAQFARDRAFISLVEDVASKSSAMVYGAVDDQFEFSGDAYWLTAFAIGPAQRRGFVILFRRKKD